MIQIAIAEHQIIHVGQFVRESFLDSDLPFLSLLFGGKQFCITTPFELDEGSPCVALFVWHGLNPPQ